MNQEIIWNNEYKNKKNLWSKETHNLPPILKNKKVLEIGVGNGKTFISILKNRPKSIVSIDISSEAVKICRNQFSGIKNTKFLVADVNELPFEDNSFNLVVCYYTLNNLIEKERVKAVSEILRVLDKKGILLFEDFEEGDFRQNSEKKVIEPNTLVKKNGLICHFFTKSEIKSLFSEFSSVKMKEKIFNPIKNKKLTRKIISLIAKK